MRKRIIIDACLLLAVTFGPWWIWLPALAVGAVAVPLFWEGIILAALADTLYGGHGRSYLASFPFALGLSLLVVLMIPVRERFRLHP